jgi:NAD(P)-dependent dehydrogenase (short-subunit alcohol dehydrogenase family)
MLSTFATTKERQMNRAQTHDGSTMKLAVLGATGSVGRELVTQALASGHEVTALVREPQPSELDVLLATSTDGEFIRMKPLVSG